MVIPAIALKVVTGAVVCGSLATSIAVPSAMSVSSSPWVVFDKFPQNYKERFKEKCQLLTQGKLSSINKKGFLFVCKGEDGYDLEFYFYSEIEDPILIKRFAEESRENDQIRVSIELITDERNLDGKIIAPINSWANVINKELSECSIKENGEKQWTLRCPKGGSDSVEIPLTPIIIY